MRDHDRAAFSTEDEWLALRQRAHTLTEAAPRLGISRRTLWRMVRSGLVPAFRLGTHWRIPGDWLVDMLRQGQ